MKVLSRPLHFQLVLTMAAWLLLTTGFAQAKFENFITRKNDVLYDGKEVFRFLNLAAPNLHQNEEQLYPDYRNRFPNEFEIRDNLESMRQLGGTATRTFTLSIKKEGDAIPVYIEDVGKYNEDAFKALDLLLHLCHEYGVRLIIPIIDSHSFYGWRGVDEFAAFRGKKGTEFWTDKTLKEDFKTVVKDILNRTNSVSGLKYKDDPAVLAWQLGNEFDSYATDRKMTNEKWLPIISDWSIEMAAFIKQHAPNQLLMEGGGLEEVFVEDPNIDIISKHYYEHWSVVMKRPHPFNLAKRIAGHKQFVGKKKAYIADEFGMGGDKNLENIMNEIIRNGASGGLLWGIRGHRRDGGFYYHNEAGTKYNSYHWPGFSQGDPYSEKFLLALLKKKAHEIRGIKVGKLPKLTSSPILFDISKPDSIVWRGVTGAQWYVLERRNKPRGKWKVVGDKLSDSIVEGEGHLKYKDTYGHKPIPLFHDKSVEPGHSYFYRIKAVNESGSSPYSNVVKLSL